MSWVVDHCSTCSLYILQYVLKSAQDTFIQARVRYLYVCIGVCVCVCRNVVCRDVCIGVCMGVCISVFVYWGMYGCVFCCQKEYSFTLCVLCPFLAQYLVLIGVHGFV